MKNRQKPRMKKRGVVEKIIVPPHPSVPEKAQIAVEGAGRTPKRKTRRIEPGTEAGLAAHVLVPEKAASVRKGVHSECLLLVLLRRASSRIAADAARAPQGRTASFTI